MKVTTYEFGHCNPLLVYVQGSLNMEELVMRAKSHGCYAYVCKQVQNRNLVVGYAPNTNNYRKMHHMPKKHRGYKCPTTNLRKIHDTC